MQLYHRCILQHFFHSLYCRRFWINRRRSCESSSRNQSQHECCPGYQRYNLFRDLIQYISLPINFLRCFAARIRRWGSSCPTQGGFSWDSPPRGCLYVHNRVSGLGPERLAFVESSLVLPGLEKCCGLTPPFDDLAMDHTKFQSPWPFRLHETAAPATASCCKKINEVVTGRNALIYHSFII